MIRIIVSLTLMGSLGVAENWPFFRGPSRQGVSRESGVQLDWSASKNIVWQADIPGAAWSSPIAFGDRIFLTTATDDGRTCRVLSLDRRTGRQLWNVAVFSQETSRKEKKNSYASPTPATDGERVYAVFGDGSIAAVDFSGKTVWVDRSYQHYSQHGLGASPVLHRDLLIMPYDGSAREGDLKVGWQKPWDQSLIVALDKRTGKLRWKASRGMSRIAHVTPNIVERGGRAQLVTAAGDVIQGFDFSTGKLIWTARSQGEGVVPSIVVGDGMIYTASGFEKPTIRAVRTGGSGDVTDTHIAWEQNKGVPKIPSFIYSKPYLFTIAENGIAMCLNADTGEIVWQERIGGEFYASPILVEGKILFVSESGDATVIRAGPEFEVLNKNSLDGPIQASPALSNGILYLRTAGKLYAIRAK